VRLFELLSPYDSTPTVIVSEQGRNLIEQCLSDTGFVAECVVQTEPRGMGDAVLCFEKSQRFDSTEHVLLVWGDIPFIEPKTLKTLIDRHMTSKNDFTFATRGVDAAYTRVQRDELGHVQAVIETRECADCPIDAGERDMGLFVFRKEPVFHVLKNNPVISPVTGEHGFLYAIARLVSQGFQVEGLPIACARDLISLNYLTDIDGHQ
jgi:bifunctional UDP-N-acetylglucosamine pyrophosphorylase/glucosamine-1-phosphate N-acetyltransferase